MSGRIELMRRVSGGETSSVFEAYDGSQRVAAKVLNPHMAADTIVRARFIREAEVLTAIRHPNIVRVFDTTEVDGSPAMIMEFLDGGSLRGTILNAARATALLEKLSMGLGEIHRRGIVHRDLRPEHVAFDSEGEPRIIDFGMASVKDLSGLTRSTVFSARPAFVDPHTWGREHALPIQDIYSLGAIMHAVLIGKPPPAMVFSRAEDPTREILLEKMREKAGSPLGEIVEAMLAEPGRRPRSAAEITDWIAGNGRTAVRDLSSCLYCSAPMPADAPVCLDCGRPPLQVEYDPDGECIVLRKISEKQEILGPFLRKLRILSAGPYHEPLLIIGDSRLYSRSEQKAGTRLPVRIAECIHSSSVEPLIELLRGDHPGAIRISRHPMAQRNRFKRGPLIAIRRGQILPAGTIESLRRLGAPAVAETASNTGNAAAAPAHPAADLRTECRYAVTLAIRALASSPDTVHLTESHRIDQLWKSLDTALSSLERTFAGLRGVRLQELYSDLERLETSATGAPRREEERERIIRLFRDHADAEREGAALHQRIVRASRVLENLRPESAAEDLREFESILA